jgi:hypothetical protein
VTVERAEGETEGFLRAYFPVNVQNMRPCEIHVRLLQGVEDEDGLPIGTVQITPRAVPRTKRDEASRQVMKKMPQKEQRSKNKNTKNKNIIDNKTKVHEFTTSGAAALQEIAPIRQAAESQKRRKIKRPITKKNKMDKSREKDREKSNNRQNMQKKKDTGRQQRQKDRKNKLQGLTTDSLRQKNTLRASEEALQNPIQIDLIKHRKPKSVSQAHLIENADVEKFVQSNKNEAKNTAE